MNMYQNVDGRRQKELLMNKIEQANEEAKKSYVPGMYIDKDKNKKISDYVREVSGNLGKAEFSEMFDQNADIRQTNLTIGAANGILDQYREAERELLNRKRQEEYEKIRPPKKNWFTLKGAEFQDELRRNQMVLNADKDYFDKIRLLQDDDLF